MNKILLALSILSAGAGGLLITRKSTIQLQHEVNATREAWSAQTQMVVVAHREQADLKAHLRELEEALDRPKATEHPLWSALQSNRAGHLPPEARERLLEELGFNWVSSMDFIVVSKETLRDTQVRALRNAKLTDVGSAALALTPAEREGIEATIERARTEFNNWAAAHTERTEPQGDIVAQYTLQRDPALTLSVSNTFASGLLAAVGRQRAELILLSARDFLSDLGIAVDEPVTLIISRYSAGNEQRFNFRKLFGNPPRYNPQPPRDPSKYGLPKEFVPAFPNGWADIAKREGFELPPPDP